MNQPPQELQLGPIKFGGTGNFDGPSSQDIPYRLLVTP
jgi:hypothetical protein